MSLLAAPHALTFDCYGTLIDWDGGIRAALQELPGLRGTDLVRLVRERELVEQELLAGGFRLYGSILAESLVLAAARQDATVTPDEAHRFAASMGGWPAFPDSARALARLAERFRLAILSNVETSVLAESARTLGAPFDALISAEELRSYKPAAGHFRAALRRLGLPREHVLHVAGSLWHDIEPAHALGWRTAWIDRRGEGLPAGVKPTIVLPDLESLTDVLLGE